MHGPASGSLMSELSLQGLSAAASRQTPLGRCARTARGGWDAASLGACAQFPVGSRRGSLGFSVNAYSLPGRHGKGTWKEGRKQLHS